MVKVSARFDEATLLPAFREHLRRKKIRRKMGRYAIFTGIFFLLALLPLSFGERGMYLMYLMPLILGASTAMLAWLFFNFERLLLKGLKKNPIYGKVVEWTLDSEKFRCETDGSKAEISWGTVFDIGEGKDGFLIYPQENLFHYLPFSGFSSPEQIAEARSYFPVGKTGS